MSQAPRRINTQRSLNRPTEQRPTEAPASRPAPLQGQPDFFEEPSVPHPAQRPRPAAPAHPAPAAGTGGNGGSTPIICVGESLEQREMNLTMEYVAYQVKAALSGVDATQLRHCVIAYEPIWAIGTGKTATAAQAQEVCEGIRAVIRKIYGARPARAVSILYGGSMNAKNAFELLAQPDIDGGLIGGASLKPADFATIVKATVQE